jgi:hypothetical protein
MHSVSTSKVVAPLKSTTSYVALASSKKPANVAHSPHNDDATGFATATWMNHFNSQAWPGLEGLSVHGIWCEPLPLHQVPRFTTGP